MASACSFRAPNGDSSDLGIALEQLYGPAETAKMMEVLHSGEALKVFDWVNNTQYNTAKEELTPDVAKALYDAVVNRTPFVAPVDPSKFTNHSGGAPGGDTFWDRLGRLSGFENHNHYRESKERRMAALRAKKEAKGADWSEEWMNKVTDTLDSQELNDRGIKPVQVSEEDYQEGVLKATDAVKVLKRKISKEGADYQYRNWTQVKYADAIFAVSVIDGATVKGGTGYAVQMAISEGKPVFVFDQVKNQWFTWDGAAFVPTETPTLTPNYAGIGTRELNENGKQAIQDVFNKTLGQEVKEQTPTEPIVPEQVDVTLSAHEQVADILKGNRTALLRTKPIEGLQPGQSATTYIAGVPMTVSYEGQRASDGSMEDLVGLGVVTAEDVAAKTEKAWVEGTEYHVYKLVPMYSLSDLLPKDAVGIKNSRIDEAALYQTLKEMVPEILDATGKSTGKLYSFEDFKDINDVILKSLMAYMLPKISGANGKIDIVNELIAGLNGAKRTQILQLMNIFKQISEGKTVPILATSPFYKIVNGVTVERAQELYEKYEQANNSWPNLAKFAVQSLQEYGIVVKPSVLNRLPELLKYDASTIVPEGTDDVIVLPEEMEGYQATLDEGKAVTNYNEKAINISLHATASKNVKLFLAGLEAQEFTRESHGNSAKAIRGNKKEVLKAAKSTIWVGGAETLLNDGRLASRTNSLNQPMLVNHKELFIKLLKAAQNLHAYEKPIIIRMLLQHSDPDLVNLGIKLEKAPEQITNELFKVINNQYSEYTKVLYGNTDTKGNKGATSRNIVANTNNERETIVTEWQENQKISKSVQVINGRMVVNKSGATRNYNKIVGYGLELEQLNKAKKIEAVKLNKIQDQLNGRALTEQQAAKLMEPFLAAKEAYEDKEKESMEYVSKFLDFLGITGITLPMLRDINRTADWEYSLKLSADGNAIGMFTKLAQSLKEASSKEDHDSTELLKNANPLYREKTTLNQLAKLKQKFNKKVNFAVNHKSIKGETIQSFSLPSFASDTFKALNNPNSDLYSLMMANPFTNKASWLLDQLRTSGGPKLTYLEGLVSTDKKSDGVERVDMSVREQFMTPLLMFHQSSSKADFVDMTKSDKTVTPVISNVEKLPVQLRGFAAPVVQQLVQIFKSEFERINYITHNESTDPNMAKGGVLFYFMPAFNYTNMEEDVMNKRITQEQFDAVWGEDGIRADYNAEVLEPLIVEYARQAIEKEQAVWMEKLGTFGGAKLLPKSQMDFMLGRWYAMTPFKVFADGKYKTGYNQTVKGMVTEISTEEAHRLGASLLVKQFVTQAYIMNTFSAMIISGDPATAYKSKGPKDTNSIIKTTMKDYQKRQAKDVAPGSIPAFSASETFVSLVIKDPVMHSEMAKLNPAYSNKDTVADAQEVTTVREHLTVMFKEGKIADQTYKEMIAVIDAGLQSPNKFYEFTEPAHTQVILQAQKPVYVNRRFEGGTYLVDYIKSSAFTLLPTMTIGTEIDKLRQTMEGSIKKGVHTGHINRAVFGSGKKLGQPRKSVALYDEYGRINEKVLTSKEFLNAQQTLTREGFKIQQEVPYKGGKEHISMVSQADRFITAGISELEGFIMPGYENPVSGKELKQIRLATVKEMSRRALAEFTQDIGGFTEIGDGIKLTDPGKFFDKLLAEAITKGYSPNEIELLRTRNSKGTLQVPLWFSGSANKLESMVMSMIAQITVPQIPGKSFVQASSIGIREYATEIPPNAGIRYIKSFDPSKGLGFMTKNEGEPSGAAQVLVPFNFFSPTGEGLKMEDYLTDGVIDPDKLPDEVLRMVGMRIPNQGMNSMLPIQIVGFLPASMGDLIIVPAEITTQMGSDFDVDKLYTYRRNYAHNAETNTLSSYSGDSEGKKLQDTYFDVYWASLTHPGLFEAVTNPLDQPDMLDEKELAEKVTTEPLSNFFMPSYQIESYDAQKDAKRMVALTALSGTFRADIEDMNIRLERTLENGTEPIYIPFKDFDGNLLQLHKLSGVGSSEYRGKKGEIMDRTKHDVNSAFQNEVLDYAKNRTIDPLNINLKTYAVVDMLINLETKDGRSIGWAHIARFMQQPIIKEYVSLMSINNDTFSDYFSSDVHGKVVNELRTKYLKANSLNPNEKISQQAFSPDELLSMIGQEINETNVQQQLSILKTFDLLHEVGTLKMRAQGVFNRGPKGPGANFIETSELQDKAESLMDGNSILAGLEDLVSSDSQRGDEFSKTVGTAMQLGNEVMPYQNLKPSISRLANLKGKDSMTTEEVFKVNNAMKAYTMSSSQIGISTNTNGRLAELLYGGNGQETLAARVVMAQGTEWGKRNFFLSNLRTKVASDISMPSTLYYMPSKITVFEDQENTKAIIELLSGDEAQRTLMQDLIDYNYLTGSTGGPTSFNQYIPISYIIGQGLHKNMTKVLDFDGWNGFARNFVQQYLQHNPDFAPRLSRTLKGTVNQLSNPNARNQINESLVLVAEVDDNAPFNRNYPPYFSVATDEDFVLYRYSHLTPEGRMVYVRIDTLGIGKMSEYNADDTYKRSLILSNRATTENLQLMDDGYQKPLKEFIREPRNEGDGDVFYTDFVELGENSTTALEMIDKISVEESPLLKLLKAATMQDAEVDSNMNETERIAQYRTKYNRIQFNMTRIGGSRKQLINMMEHEYTHAVTARTLGDIRKLSDKEATKKYGPAVMQAYYQLEALRVQLAKDHKGNELMDYATASIDELITHAFTDKAVQQLLNSTPYATDVSLLDQFKNLINSLLKAIAQAAGFEVTEGSALEAVIMNATAIIANNGSGQGFTTQEDTVLGATYFQNDVLVAVVPAEIRTAVKDLEAHKKKLESMQFTQSGKDTAQLSAFVLRGQEIDALQADIDSLKTMGSFELLAVLGTRQVEWAKGILAQPAKSFEDLAAAHHTAKTWSNLIKNMYSGVDPDKLSARISKLKGDASALEVQVLAEFKRNSGVKASDFDQEALSTSLMEAGLRDLGQVKSKVGQLLYAKISEQKKFRVEELRKFNQKATAMVTKVTALAKKRGLKYSDIMEKLIHGGDEWGLVSNYSPALAAYQKKIQQALQSKTKAIYAMNGLTQEQKYDRIKAIKREYKVALESKLSYINVSILLDQQTGELKDTPSSQAEIAKLNAEIGADMVDKMIQEAQKNYMQYLQEKESYENVINASYDIHVMQIPTLYAMELAVEADPVAFKAQKIAEAEALRADKLRVWEGQNSPFVFYQMLSGLYQKGLAGQFRAYNRLVTAPKISSAEFFDSKYQEIMKDPELLEVYNFIKENLDKYMDMLPVSVQDRLGDSFLPIMEAADNTITLGGAWTNIKETVAQALLVKEDLEKSLRSEHRAVPLKFISDARTEVADRERDPMVLLSKFADMALHFNGMTSVQAYAELAQQAVIEATRDTAEGRFAVLHSGSEQLSKMLQHYMDVEMYQKPRAQQGVMESVDTYSINPFKNAQIKKQIKAIDTELEKLHQDQKSGAITISEFVDKLPLLQLKRDKLTENKSHYSASKAGDMAIRLTQLKALAWNPMSAIANLTFGVVSLTVHANAKTDFDLKTMMSTIPTMAEATRKALGNDNPTARKILALMDRLNLMGDLLDSDSPGESKLVTRGKEKWKKIASPYQLLRQSDYYMKGSIAVSMAKYKMIEVERDGKKVTMSLWEAMDSEGKIEGGAEWYNEADSSVETEFQKFRNRAVGVAKIIMGNQDSNSPLWIKMGVAGRLVSQFRISWLAEGVAQRFMGERYNEQLERQVKGRYRTYGNLGLMGSLKMLAAQAVFSKTAFQVDGKEISEVDKENMRKNLSELVWYLTLFGMGLMLEFLSDDEEEKKKTSASKFLRFMINTVTRTTDDISFYGNPGSTTDALSNIVPASKVLVDITRALDGTRRILFDDENSQFTEKQAAYRWFKTLPPLSMIPKIERAASKFK